MRSYWRTALVGAVCVAAVLAGGAGYLLLRQGNGKALEELSSHRFSDPTGQAVALSQWHGTPLLINFWATWCEPCREEVPELVRAQRTHGKSLQVVGIGVDSPGKIGEFAKTYNVNYPMVVAGPEVIEITRRLGNTAGGLPYTLAIDASGHLQSRHLGGMSRERIEELVRAAQR
jgi:thiol-disulfide isomerase/thioredoxin